MNPWRLFMGAVPLMTLASHVVSAASPQTKLHLTIDLI
jgi:hypothetical protein